MLALISYPKCANTGARVELHKSFLQDVELHAWSQPFVQNKTIDGLCPHKDPRHFGLVVYIDAHIAPAIFLPRFVLHSVQVGLDLVNGRFLFFSSKDY